MMGMRLDAAYRPDTPGLRLQGSLLAIDGKTLGEYGLHLADLRIGAAEPAYSLQALPGRAGSLDLTLEGPGGAAMPASRKLEADVRAIGGQVEVAEAKLAIAAVSGRRVELAYAPMRHAMRGRVSVGEWKDSAGWSECTLEATVDPYLYGRGRTAALATGSNGLRPSGTAPSWPVLALRPGAVNAVRATLDSGDYVEVQAAGAGFGTAIVSIDMGTGLVAVNGTVSGPTLASDFWCLLPGAVHDIRLSTGTGTMTYTEMWML